MRTHINGIDIFFDVAGPGLAARGEAVADRPTIILLHGGPGLDHMVFRPAFDRLADHAQVIYYDHRACGRSEAGPKRLWTIEQWSDDIAAFIIQLGLKRPIILGTSFGGFIAQRFSARHQNLAGGVVLMSTAARADVGLIFDNMEKRGGAAARAAAEAFFSDAAAPGVVDRYVENCHRYYTVGELDMEVMARVTMRPDVMMHFFQQGGEFYTADFRKDLTKITAPTLIVHGEEDPIFPIALADEMLECLRAPRKTLMRATVGPPDARLVRIPNCGHLSEQDAPDVIMDAVIDFFRLQ